ncbi:MAG: pantetheine-phosphate adenylyltransferase [Clostridiales bacterium]|nr:pantetheine-phosphate adenylyltransferase [Clostridiales bacterium]
MRICVYPGSFDPITCGHMDIIERIVDMFDRVVIGVLQNREKQPLFSLDERLGYIRRCTPGYENVEVEAFDGLLVDFARAKKALYIVRGLRAVSDFEFEFQMASMNKKLYPEAETIFLMTNTKYSFLSSSMVREVGRWGGCLRGLVPGEILPDLMKRLKNSL